MVLRPLISVDSRRRRRPTTAQFSANRILKKLFSLSGARPTKTVTGTSCTEASLAGSDSSISRVSMWGERLFRRREKKPVCRRDEHQERGRLARGADHGAPD